MTREIPAREPRANENEAGVERELKFLADRKVLKAAEASPILGGEAGALTWRRLRTVYFDDEDGDLSRARIALRVRRADGGFVMGLKREASEDRGAFEREETEVPLPTGEPELSRFPKTVAREVTDVTGNKPLAPKFGSDIRRAARTIEAHGAAIEVAFDDGFLFAGERRAPIAEIELELKSGAPVALFDLGLEFVDMFPLKLGLRSKAERAHAMMTSAPPECAYAEAPSLRAGGALDEAIAAIMHNCLAHFLGNLPALEAGDAVEAVHQMRVAMRRLHSALGLFGRAFPHPEFDALRAESKRIASALGEARDWDVFAGRLCDGALGPFVGEPGFDALIAASRAKAAAGRAAVAVLVGDSGIARFALRLERFAAARGWRDRAREDALAALNEPVEAFATRWLAALDRKVRRRGRHLGSLTPDQRHALRIALKRARYATEFFGGLFPPKSAAERYARRAAALQDLLGDLNDAAITLRLVRSLGPPRTIKSAYAAGVVSGWSAKASEGDVLALKRAWRNFAETEPFWRREDKDGEPA